MCHLFVTFDFYFQISQNGISQQVAAIPVSAISSTQLSQVMPSTFMKLKCLIVWNCLYGLLGIGPVPYSPMGLYPTPLCQALDLHPTPPPIPYPLCQAVDLHPTSIPYPVALQPCSHLTSAFAFFFDFRCQIQMKTIICCHKTHS